ncbi:MAG: GPW/gp25 family protein [Ilumatobacter sp.]|nr:GPW/gp25 family protein [Ilumatobacter sp.]
MSDPADFVGRGFAWPFGVDQTGSIATTSGTDGIASALRMILSTAPGERTMRPDFGCRIWHLLFEPINANTMGLMADAVREAVGRWEPRIVLDDVRVEPDSSAEGKVQIFLDYHTKATNDRRNLVFPFYVIPLEGES